MSATIEAVIKHKYEQRFTAQQMHIQQLDAKLRQLDQKLHQLTGPKLNKKKEAAGPPRQENAVRTSLALPQQMEVKASQTTQPAFKKSA